MKPYRFFKHTGDINAPPGFSKNGQTKEPSGSNTTEAVKEPSTTGGSYERQEERKDEESKDNGDVAEPSTSAVPPSDDSTLTSEPVPPAPETSEYEFPEAPIEADFDDDDYLYHLEDILTRIHTAFYQMYDQLPVEERPPDMKSVVPYVKNKVLKSCNIVFSGVVPTNVPIESSAIYKAAVAFGANVQKDVVLHHGKHRRSQTTHLVAAKWGTAKVYQARKAGSSIKIVTPQWLWCCVERWEREDERLFLLSKDTEVVDARRRGKRKDGDVDTFAEPIEPDYPVDQVGSSLLPPEFEGAQSRNTSADIDADLDYEPGAKRSRDDDNLDDDSLSSSSSTSSSTKSKTEDEDSPASGDEEMAEALEKQFE